MLTEIFERHLLKESSKDPNYKPKPKFRPSSLGSPCLRKILYAYLRVPPDFKASLQLKKYATKGNAAHEMLSDIFRKEGVLVDYYNEQGEFVQDFWDPSKIDYEFPIKDPDLDMSLKIDAVLIIDGKLWLGEWKSATKNSFGKLMKPKPDHLVQGASYVFTFEKALNEGKFKHIPALDGFTSVEGVKFLYVDMDNLDMKEFNITKEIATPIFAQTVNKIAYVKQCREQKVLPGTTQDWCNSCDWRVKCTNNYNPMEDVQD